MLGRRAGTRLSLGVTVLCYGIASTSVAQITSQSGEEAATLHGTVLNSVTHEPVGRALVYSPDNRFATLTDSSGRFAFRFRARETDQKAVGTPAVPVPAASSAPPDRPSMLMARKPGFITPDGNQNVVMAQDQTDLTIYLVPEALIVGHVNLPGSDGSDKVQVELLRRQVQDGRPHWNSVNTVTTRSDGEFRFADLQPGTYKLLTHEQLDRDPLTFDPRGQLYGYPPVYFPAANNFAAATAVQLTAGMTFQANFSPARREYYPVEIAVTNAPEGTGLNVQVFVASGEKGPGYSLGYNAEEQKIQGSLPDGTYTVEVWSFGPTQGTGSATITVGGGPARGQSVTVVPNGGIPVNVTQEFTQAQNTNAAGVVSSFVSTGGTMTHVRSRPANVYLEPAGEFGYGMSASLRQPKGPDDDSIFLENVQPGRYWVHVEPNRGYAASVRSGGTDLLHHPLVVPQGGSSTPIEVTLRDDSAQLEGTLDGANPNIPRVSAPQAPTAHIYLIPLPESSGHFREVWASPGEKFSALDIPPGEYRVLAFDHPRPDLEYRNDQAMIKYDSKGAVIRLLPGQKEHVRLHIISESD
jgi:hypothetical protein